MALFPQLGRNGKQAGQKYAPGDGSLLEEVGGRASQGGPPPTGEERCVAFKVSNHTP